MSRQWLLKLSAADAAAAAPLRLHRGVEVCPDRDALWLRGPHDSAVERTLWLLPGERFHLAERDQLIPWNHLLPVATAPAGPWTPLASFLAVAPTVAALPGTIADRAHLQLVRTTREQPVELLVVPLASFTRFVDTAPTLRLARLRFALSADSRILVRGTPLPALPAAPYTLAAGIALPAGLGFSPPVPAATIAQTLGLQKDDIALFAPDASCEIIPAAAWVALTRSAVRISLEGLAP
jgi:hypothetical protein